MADGAIRIETPHGVLEVEPMEARTREALGSLFAIMGETEHEGQRMLALVASVGQRTMCGLRIGYGWYEPDDHDDAQGFAAACWTVIPAALQRFRARSFRGALFPTAYWSGKEGEHLQAGELVFMRTHGTPEPASEDQSLWDRELGGSSDLLMEFAKDLAHVWKAEGLPSRTFTDLEPCPATDPGIHWRGDLALVDDRIVLLGPRLDRTDPLLPIVRQAGIERVEHGPTIVVTRAEQGED